MIMKLILFLSLLFISASGMIKKNDFKEYPINRLVELIKAAKKKNYNNILKDLRWALLNRCLKEDVKISLYKKELGFKK